MNKHHYLQISFLLFFFLCAIAPLSSQTPTASFATWKDNKKAAYSIIHDDYSDYVTGIFQYADPIATSRGIKLCFGAITNFCGATEWANARTMIAHGHECVNHSHNHLCGGSASECSGLSTYNASQFPTELGLSSQLIETNTGVKPRFFIHPYDASSTAIINYLTGLGYLGTRSGNRSIVNDNTFTDFMHLNYFVYMPNSQILLLNQAVDQAVTAGGYTIREFHGIEDGSWAAMTVANYTDHLNYVKTQMDNGNIWSATTTEAITYKIQRDAFQPVASRSNLTGDITVSFNTLKTIDPSVLRTPVTVNVNLNGITGNFNVTQIGTPIPSTRTGNIVTFNVYPHQGNVVLNYIDVTPPVLTACHTNISLTTTGTTAVASWTAPTATDNASIPIVSFTTSPTAGLTNGGAFPIGTTTVRYTATDAKNNTATCSFTVTVTLIDPCATDIIPPVLTACPSNISLTTTGTTAIASWTAPTATDNCTTPSVSLTTSPTTGLTNGGSFPIGTTTVRYTATDAKNNTSTCSFTVTVTLIDPCATDVTPPVLTACPTNISLTTTGTTAIASWTVPTATDNCTTPSITFATSPTVGLTNGGAFPIGTTTVRYTATDAKNNTATCSFTVTVTLIDPCATDIIPPVLTACPSNISLTTNGTTALASWTAPTATDNCTIPIVSFTTSPTVSLTNGGAFPIGTTTVTYTASDVKNSTICSFTVMVMYIDPCATDIIPPVLTACPSNISLATTGTTAIASWTAPTATDNCTTPSVTFATSPTVGLTNGGAFPIGTTTVRYTATDAKNNTATCSFSVSVTYIDPCLTDITPPVLTVCPANTPLATTGTTALVSWTAPTATDNCTPPSVTFTTSPTTGLTNGSGFPIGTTTVTYTATDAKNNTATCSFSVIVTLIDPCLTDITPPVLTACPANISLTTTGTTTTASWTAPTATDNCTAPSVTFTTSPTAGLTNGGAFPIGTTTVTYTATDAKNNTATCSFSVIVTLIDPCLTDITPPVLTACPANISLTTTGTTATASWTAPTATDNCTIPIVSFTTSPTTGLTNGGTFPIGTTTVRYTATDAKNNTETCSFTVSVTLIDPCATDIIPPVLTACPANISLTTTGATALASWTAPTATDNCTIPIVSFTTSPTFGLTNGGAFPIGTTTVRYTATDAKNNTSTCSFNVVVTLTDPCATDVIPPVLTTCSSNISLTTTGTTAIASWTAPTATDNCTIPIVSFTTSPTVGLTNGGAFPIGTTTVRYTATDAKNNTATCSFTVVVTQQSTGGDVCTQPTTHIQGAVNAINVTGIATSAAHIQVFSSFWSPVYSQQVNTPSATVPNLAAGGYYIKVTVLGAGGIWPSICEVLQPVTVTSSTNPCITDATPPVLSACPANMNLTTATTTAIASWTAPTATDNCSTPSVSFTSSPTTGLSNGGAFPIGTTTVTYTATDAKNNTATCRFTVTVTQSSNCAADIVPPLLTSCPANMNLTTATTTTIASWTAPTATDNCTTPSVIFTTSPTTGLTNGGTFPLGTTTVRYTATDAKNNTATCSFTLGVTQSSSCATDIVPPVLTACPANMNLTTATTTTIASWTAPTATDNCSPPSVIFTSSPTTGLTNGGVFPIGTTTVRYTAKDAKNNTATCSFTVTVTQQSTGGNICTQPAANIVGSANAITISGITTSAAHIQIFTSVWSPVYSQLTTTATVNVPNLAAGGYFVKVTVLGAGGKWPAVCDVQQNVTVAPLVASLSQAVLALEAHAEPTRAVIEWVNNTGYINDYFTIEKADTKTGIFETLEIVNNKSVDKDMTHYVTYDNTPTEGDNSYRIAVIHNDGSTKVSDIKTVQFKGLYSVRLFPNPVNDVLTLDLSNYKNQNVEVYLYNYFGHLQLVRKIDKVTDALFDISVSDIQTGNYKVRIQSKKRRAVTQSVIIAH